MRKAKVVLLSLFLLAIALSITPGASDPRLGWLRTAAEGPAETGSSRGVTAATRMLAGAEPLTILLLGGGLLLLVLYAKRKHGHQG